MLKGQVFLVYKNLRKSAKLVDSVVQTSKAKVRKFLNMFLMNLMFELFSEVSCHSQWGFFG